MSTLSDEGSLVLDGSGQIRGNTQDRSDQLQGNPQDRSGQLVQGNQQDRSDQLVQGNPQSIRSDPGISRDSLNSNPSLRSAPPGSDTRRLPSIFPYGRTANNGVVDEHLSKKLLYILYILKLISNTPADEWWGYGRLLNFLINRDPVVEKPVVENNIIESWINSQFPNVLDVDEDFNRLTEILQTLSAEAKNNFLKYTATANINACLYSAATGPENEFEAYIQRLINICIDVNKEFYDSNRIIESSLTQQSFQPEFSFTFDDYGAKFTGS